MFTKESIREDMKARRLQMSEAEVKRASNACATQLFSMPDYQHAKTILLYAAIHNEVETKAILEDALANNKMVGMPVSDEDGIMEFYTVFDWEDLTPGRFGILEPPTDIKMDGEEGLLIVPAVAFDSHKNRIGQGGGFYDRYIAGHPNLSTIGLAYDFQLVDAIEAQPYDKKVDLIITDTQVIV